VSPEERALIERCRQRDESAWAELYRSYAPRLARFLRVYTGRCEADLEDLVQRTFIEMLGAVGRFRGDAAISTLLFRIGVRVAAKAARSESRRRQRNETWGAGWLVERGDSEASAHGQVEARGELQSVESALAEVHPKHRAVWVMREIEGLSTEEVAIALGIPVITVRTRHFRARQAVLAAVERAEERRKAELARRAAGLLLLGSIGGCGASSEGGS
jgi:RNA polymerase sigma-70 factor (ECF subfamily)